MSRAHGVRQNPNSSPETGALLPLPTTAARPQLCVIQGQPSAPSRHLPSALPKPAGSRLPRLAWTEAGPALRGIGSKGRYTFEPQAREKYRSLIREP